MALSVLLGAGFSLNANLPLAKEINKHLTNSIWDKTERLLSGEYTYNKNGNYIFNNSNNEHLSKNPIDFFTYYRSVFTGLMLEGWVVEYKNFKNGNFNYEECLQFILNRISSKEKNIEIKTTAYNKYRFISDKGQYKLTFDFEEVEDYNIIELFNYLIAHLLNLSPTADLKSYNSFINFVRKNNCKSIASLNHDLLLEKLLLDNSINYEDGFDTRFSVLKYAESAINMFDPRHFTNKHLKLLKLHGSIDMYEYKKREFKDGEYKNEGQKFYYKTINNRVNHLIEINTGFDGHYASFPKFITGTEKKKIVENDYMYKELFNSFCDNLHNCEELLIIGYSYQDDYINEGIVSSIKNGKLKKVISVNPNDKFMLADENEVNLLQLNSIEQLI
jgi:hypothetical protein